MLLRRVIQNHSPGLQERIVSKLTWRLLPFLFLLYVIAYLDRTNVSFAALQMRAQLGISDRAYGLGAGMFAGLPRSCSCGASRPVR